MKILALAIALAVLIVNAAAVVQLSGSDARAILDKIPDKNETLWSWGSVPAGHVLLNNSRLAEGASIPGADRSSMETPSQIIPQNGGVGGIGSLDAAAYSNPPAYRSTIPEPQATATSQPTGSSNMPSYYQKGSKGFGSNVLGIFDCTCFKAPTAAEFPRV